MQTSLSVLLGCAAGIAIADRVSVREIDVKKLQDRLKSNGARKPIATNRYLPVVSYVQMLTETFMQAVSREYVHADYWQKTIVVDTGEISSVSFDMTREQKLELYDIGYRTAMTVIPLKLGELLQ